MSSIGMYCSLGVLAIATIDDVRTRKIHNVLLGVLAVISIVVMGVANGVAGIQDAVLGAFAGMALYFPLAWMGVVGGGDVKLLAVTGLSAGVLDTAIIGLIAIAWGAVLGVIQVVIKGELKSLVNNIITVGQFKKLEPAKLHKIPFAAALLLAALTKWSLARAGGSWL